MMGTASPSLMVQLVEGKYDMMGTASPPFPTKIIFNLEHKVANEQSVEACLMM